MTDIVNRLKNNKICLGHGDYDVDPLSLEAANEIERLREESEMRLRDASQAWDKCEEMRIKKEILRETLKPFAEYIRHAKIFGTEDYKEDYDTIEECNQITVEEIRRAKEVYENTK